MDFWGAIATLMDDDVREDVHAELAPCTKREFLKRYLELDPDFEENILLREFGIADVDEFEEYSVYHIGGKKDGKELASFSDLNDAEIFAREYEAKHNDEPDFIGVGIIDVDGNEIETW